MGRPTKDQRREDYLDLGAAIVAESRSSGVSDPGLALAHVKLAEVAERAGVTKGALYHLWPSQEAYWRDLLQHLLSTNRLFGADRLATVSAELIASRGEQQTLRDWANDLFDSVRDDPAFFARVSLFAYLDDEQVRTTLDEEARSAIDSLQPVLAAAVADMGRRPRSEGALRDLAVELAALLEGLSLKYRVDPEQTPDLPPLRGRRLTLFAAAADALLQAFTEPAGDVVGRAKHPVMVARTGVDA
jgi:AcrR family transcriptional regulator